MKARSNATVSTTPETRTLEKELERILRRRAMNEEQAIRAARLLAEGKPVQSVAHTFAVSTTTIYKTLRRYGIPSPASLDPELRVQRTRASYAARPHRLSREQAVEAARLRSRGRSLISIAHSFDVAEKTVRETMKRHGLRPDASHRPHRPRTGSDNAKAPDLTKLLTKELDRHLRSCNRS